MTLTSPSAIATMVASAKNGGFNTLPAQVRGRGDATHGPGDVAQVGRAAFHL